MDRGRRSRDFDSALTLFVEVVRIYRKRGYSRRIEMLDSRESSPPVVVPDPVSVTESRDVTELLLGVLRSIEPYEACILEAEQDGDFEVAAFLRELRRQDLIRAREATRLLRRSLVGAYTNVVRSEESPVGLSVGS
jgi:hypothetical protein